MYKNIEVSPYMLYDKNFLHILHKFAYVHEYMNVCMRTLLTLKTTQKDTCGARILNKLKSPCASEHYKMENRSIISFVFPSKKERSENCQKLRWWREKTLLKIKLKCVLYICTRTYYRVLKYSISSWVLFRLSYFTSKD